MNNSEFYEQIPNLNLVANLPVCSFRNLAEICEVSEGVVRGWAQNKYVPTIKLGKYTMINLEKFKRDLLKQA